MFTKYLLRIVNVYVTINSYVILHFKKEYGDVQGMIHIDISQYYRNITIQYVHTIAIYYVYLLY